MQSGRNNLGLKNNIQELNQKFQNFNNKKNLNDNYNKFEQVKYNNEQKIGQNF